MRRPVFVAFVAAVALLGPARALAAAPAVTAIPLAGAAPLEVTLSASGGGEPYRWDLGDGTFATGAVVQHTYAAGEWVATVIGSDGVSTSVTVRAESVFLQAPARGTFGARAVFRGSVVPAGAGTPVALETGGRAVASAVTTGDGSFRFVLPHLAGPGPYLVRSPLAASAAAAVRVRPGLAARVVGTPLAERRFTIEAALRPAGAGSVRIRIYRGARLLASVKRPGGARPVVHFGTTGPLRIEIDALPADGWLGAHAALRPVVLAPSLARGARGPSVRVLEQRLAAMHYALQRVGATFDEDTQEAVWAFQKVHGLARTGSVDAALWQRILHGTTPSARYQGDHVEVDKARQVLFEVRDGQVVLVVHVSTGATGNTPVGIWRVYRRVAGFDWVLYFPTYFLRGFAIHGYPSVPPYPASHGCVRVPMWVAPRLYLLDPFGYTVYVYN